LYITATLLNIKIYYVSFTHTFLIGIKYLYVSYLNLTTYISHKFNQNITNQLNKILGYLTKYLTFINYTVLISIFHFFSHGFIVIDTLIQ